MDGLRSRSHSLGRIAIAGVLGVLAMSAVLGFFRILGLSRISFERIFAELITESRTPPVIEVGLPAFLLFGVIMAFVYCGILFLIGKGGWLWGALLGFSMAILAAYTYQVLLLAPTYAPAIVPFPLYIPERFGFGGGPGAALAMLLGHLVYGAIVGGMTSQLTRRAVVARDKVKAGDTSYEERKPKAA